MAEANEQLALVALHAESVAETAVSELGELARSGQRDPLTGLPNRLLMLDRLENAIATARRHETRIAVLFIDLDNFKRINDTLGHAIGDEALKLAARRLQSAVRDSDTVSRHGGEEFLVLLPTYRRLPTRRRSRRSCWPRSPHRRAPGSIGCTCRRASASRSIRRTPRTRRR